MSSITQIIAYTLPALLVAFVAYFFIRQMVENERKRTLLEMRKQQQNEMLKIVTPLRLQAYERLSLFLERINPNSLVLRCAQPEMNTKLLQGVMTKNIRDEYEHNLSQQIFVSEEVWNLVKNAKEEMINLINSSSLQLSEETSHVELAGLIFSATAGKKTPVDIAMEVLKKEIQELFK